MARAVLTGTPGSPGVAAGRLLWIAPPARAAATPIAGADPDPAGEEARLRAALEETAAELEALALECSARAGQEVGAIFEAQALFARDPSIVDPAIASIREGLGAVGAIERAAAQQAEVLAGLDDAYFRERAADVRDVGRRVAGRLTGQPPPTVHHADGTPAIVAGDDLDPSVVAVVRPELVAGLAMGGGAVTGHAAIVARALGIPLVVGLGAALEPGLAGLDAIVDGEAGRLIVEPVAADRAMLAWAPPGVDEARDVELTLPVRIEANVGSVDEAERAAAAGARGIGLVRTELLFLGRSVPPGFAEQRSLYARIRGTMPDWPVVFRTLDIGGDKPADWAVSEPEPNPALGVRGVRLGLRRSELLETQLRAIVEAGAGRRVDVMLPMVATLDEVHAARLILEGIIEAVGSPVDVRLGIMIEVPAAALTADVLAEHVDFFSIGTNDLVQYTMAADRTNPALGDLASPFQPAVLRLIRLVTDAAASSSRPVAVCGESAADPAAAGLFVGLGVSELSVAPSAIRPLRAALDGLELDACRRAAEHALEARTEPEVQAIANRLVGVSAPA
jgi:multiphosphoryl transfer protein